MPYFDKVLQPGESVRFQGYLHWLVYLRGLVSMVAGIAVLIVGLLAEDRDLGRVLGLAALAILAGSACLLVLSGLRRQTVEFVVTDKRVIYKTGLLSRYTAEMNVSKIESVDVEQGVMGRIFGFGTLLIRGTGASFEPLRGVANPIGLRNAIMIG